MKMSSLRCSRQSHLAAGGGMADAETGTIPVLVVILNNRIASFAACMSQFRWGSHSRRGMQPNDLPHFKI